MSVMFVDILRGEGNQVMNNKSILDVVPVNYDRAPSFKPSPKLSVVGNCPTCGAPLYGPKEAFVGETPDIQRTCSCESAKRFHETK